jgi:hypothetical protein
MGQWTLKKRSLDKENIEKVKEKENFMAEW